MKMDIYLKRDTLDWHIFTDNWKERQSNEQSNRQSRKTEKQPGKQKDRETNIKTYKQIDR